MRLVVRGGRCVGPALLYREWAWTRDGAGLGAVRRERLDGSEVTRCTVIMFVEVFLAAWLLVTAASGGSFDDGKGEISGLLEGAASVWPPGACVSVYLSVCVCVFTCVCVYVCLPGVACFISIVVSVHRETCVCVYVCLRIFVKRNCLFVCLFPSDNKNRIKTSYRNE